MPYDRTWERVAAHFFNILQLPRLSITGHELNASPKIFLTHNCDGIILSKRK
jgi:hypothetical protein